MGLYSVQRTFCNLLFALALGNVNGVLWLGSEEVNMRSLWIVCGVLVLGLAIGCKKDEGAVAESTGGGTTAAAPNGKEGPATPPDIKETGGESGGTAVTMESVAGTYDSVTDEATKAQMEKAGTPFGGGEMTFHADGSFEAHVKVGDQERHTKGTYTLEGDTITTTISELDGKPAEGAPSQKYIVGSDGNLTLPGVTAIKFVKK